ncbi:MAG: hypothetical protein NTX33_03420, partial [Propionibacteriales bacterium]|nr:hypothetical protein [Propionibacteriales bacterium]
ASALAAEREQAVDDAERARIEAEEAAAEQAAAREAAETRASALAAEREQAVADAERARIEAEEAAAEQAAAREAAEARAIALAAERELAVADAERARAEAEAKAAEPQLSLLDQWRAGATATPDADDTGESAPTSLVEQWRASAADSEPSDETLDPHESVEDEALLATSDVEVEEPEAVVEEPEAEVEEPEAEVEEPEAEIEEPEAEIEEPEAEIEEPEAEIEEPEAEIEEPEAEIEEPEAEIEEPEAEIEEPEAEIEVEEPVAARERTDHGADVVAALSTPTTATTKGIPFHSKRGNDSLGPIAILAALACAAVVARMAIIGTLRDDIALSATMTIAAAVLLMYALRMSNTSRSVHIDESGLLKVTVGDTNSRFDLTSPNTKIEQTGTAGQRNWRILVLRRSMSPVAIDSRMVDAHTFLEALRQWKPDL